MHLYVKDHPELIPEISDNAKAFVETFISFLTPQEVKDLNRYNRRSTLELVISLLFIRQHHYNYHKDFKGCHRPFVTMANNHKYFDVNASYLKGRPLLLDLFTTNGVSLRSCQFVKALLLKYDIVSVETGYPKWVVKENKIDVDEGYGRLTTLRLRSITAWTLDTNNRDYSRLIAIYSAACYESSKKYKHMAVIRKNINGVKQEFEANPYISKMICDINNMFDDPYLKKLTTYRYIAGEDELDHGRNYAPVTIMSKTERALLMKSMSFMEYDLRSASSNIFYKIKTGQFFFDPIFKDDIYSAIASHTEACKHNPRLIAFLRPAIKIIMTKALGHGACSRKKLLVDLGRTLNDMGLLLVMSSEDNYVNKERAFCKKTHQVISEEQLRSEYKASFDTLYEEALIRKKNNWVKYCREHNLPSDMSPPTLTAAELHAIIYDNFEPLTSAWFNSGYKVSSRVETQANLYMYQMALANNIQVITVHDCVYCKQEDSEQIMNWRLDGLHLAAIDQRGIEICEKKVVTKTTTPSLVLNFISNLFSQLHSSYPLKNKEFNLSSIYRQTVFNRVLQKMDPGRDYS